MLKVLYGKFKITKKSDYIITVIKSIYLVITAPFLIFWIAVYFASFAFLTDDISKENFDLTKKILLHFAALIVSFFGWGGVLYLVTEYIPKHLLK